MIELTAAETAVLAAIESSPGIPAMDLSKQLGRRAQDVLRTIQALVDKGEVVRRPVERTHEYVRQGRSESRTRSYNGLFAATRSPAIETLEVHTMNEGFWWRRLCLKDIRREVLLGVEPGLEGRIVFDGPWPTREAAAIHRAAGIPGMLLFESIMVDVGPTAALEATAP